MGFGGGGFVEPVCVVVAYVLEAVEVCGVGVRVGARGFIVVRGGN